MDVFRLKSTRWILPLYFLEPCRSAQSADVTSSRCEIPWNQKVPECCSGLSLPWIWCDTLPNMGFIAIKSSGTKPMTTCVANFILQKSFAVSARDKSLVEWYIQKETMMQLHFLLKAALKNSYCFWQDQLDLHLSASQNPSLDALATLPKTYQICSTHHDQQLVFPRVFARASVSNTVP